MAALEFSLVSFILVIEEKIKDLWQGKNTSLFFSFTEKISKLKPGERGFFFFFFFLEKEK